MKALITGASEGIGRSFAKRLNLKGYAITAVARNETRLRELMTDLEGSSNSFIVSDLGTEGGQQKIVELLLSEKFDLLINNAGGAIYGEFTELTDVQMDEMMTLNCESLLRLSMAFLRSAKKGAALINVSSGASFLPMPISSVYTGTKAFVTAFTEALWYEERKKNVYVMALCPGVTRTKFHTRAGGKAEQVPTWLSQTPDQVVEIALKQLARRKKPLVVCGPQKWLILASRLLPRKVVVLLAGKTLELAMR